MPFNCIHYSVWTFIKGRHPPGSLPSEISVTLPPRKLQTYFAAAISSSEAATPFHRNRPSGNFSTNTSLVFSLDAEGSTWVRRETESVREEDYCLMVIPDCVHICGFRHHRPPQRVMHGWSSGGCGRVVCCQPDSDHLYVKSHPCGWPWVSPWTDSSNGPVPGPEWHVPAGWYNSEF